MAEVDAKLVKTLRERTGIGFMQCKQALSEAGGDLEKAVVLLRQKGLESAEKKADRAASQGRIAVAIDAKTGRGAALELACESDFVARNDDFVAMSDRIAALLAGAEKAPSDVAALLSAKLTASDTVEQQIKSAIAKIGENIVLKRFVRFDPPAGGRCGFYVHPPGRIGVLLELGGVPAGKEDDAASAARDLCMQVAAMNPLAATPEEIPADVREREQAVYAVQARGKPPQVVEKIVKGKMESFYAERCLLKQAFVKDATQTVEAYLKSRLPGASVRRFTRLEVGA